MLGGDIHVLAFFAAEESASPSLAFLFLLMRWEMSEAAGLGADELEPAPELELGPAPLDVDAPSPFDGHSVSRTLFIVCELSKTDFNTM